MSEVTLTLAQSQARFLIDVLENVQDEGPEGVGWKSKELSALCAHIDTQIQGGGHGEKHPELEEPWKMQEVLLKPFDLGTRTAVVVEMRSKPSNGQYRMAVRPPADEKNGWSPYVVATLMENMASWLKNRFNPDGTLTERGRIGYLRALGEEHD